MKCYNCGKEVNENENFCSKCGEEVNDGNINNINMSESGQSEHGENIDFNDQLNKGKDFLKNNKKAVTIGGAIIGVLLAVLIIFNLFTGNGVGKNQVKEDLIGQSFYTGNEYIQISSDNLKSVKITSSDSKKKQYDKVTCDVELNINNIELTVEYEMYYIYSDKWQLSYGSYKSLKDVKLDASKEDAIKASLTENGMYANNSYYIVSGELVKDVKNIVVTNEETSTTFEADITLSNGIATQEGKVSGNLYLSINEGKWVVNNAKITSLQAEVILDQVDEEALKNNVLSILGNGEDGRRYSYEVKNGEDTDSIYVYVNNSQISDLTITDKRYMADSAQYRVEFECKVSPKIVSGAVLKGTVLFSPSIGTRSNANIDAKIEGGNIEYPTEADIKTMILDKSLTYGGSKINGSASDSFKETKRINKSLSALYVQGTIELDGETVEVQVNLSLSRYGASEWSFNSVVGKDSIYYEAE